METGNETSSLRKARLKAFLLDWLIWAYVPVGFVYLFRDTVSDLPFAVWLYLGGVGLGLVLALLLEIFGGITIGEKLVGLAPEIPVEERGKYKRAPWYKTLVGLTALLLFVETFVLGWNITEINLYYVFTRADKMQNITDRLLRPYWPVFGTLIEKLIETIFLALMATVGAIPLGALVSFFAARNIMYSITAKWGKLISAFVFAIFGAWLGIRISAWLLIPLQDTVIDVDLVGGIVQPLFLLLGLVLFSYIGAKATNKILESPFVIWGRVQSALFTACIGVLAVYLCASLVWMVVFGASWRIFVERWAPWPQVLLAVGAVVGGVYGARMDPRKQVPVGQIIYFVVRFILNATRSIEPFVWALIFVTWFRLGPFPGTVALLVHSVAALGKLYSEQIESIDHGPVEAVRSTGANELQTIVYAVIPQIIPPFISFTIYRWDINVRMSTIIGLVGGGGIGQMLFQYQNLAQWRKVSVAVILIVVVVMTLDNLSAKIREKIL